MSSRIKHVSDLPKWFNLDKYKKAKKLDAAGWHRQLAFRGKIADSFYEKIEVEFRRHSEIRNFQRINPTA